jgi:hypothetical protein
MNRNDGLMVTLFGSLLVRETNTPPTDAVASLTGKLADSFGPMCTLAGMMICVTFATLTVAVPLVRPEADAVIVTLPPFPAVGVTTMLVLVEPWEIVTLAGTDATLGLVLARLMVCPPAPAGEDRETVKELLALFPISSGFGPRVITTGAVTVTDTVAGLLFAMPSFTMSCTT